MDDPVTSRKRHQVGTARRMETRNGVLPSGPGPVSRDDLRRANGETRRPGGRSLPQPEPARDRVIGAEDGIRTRDLDLGKVARYRCATSARDDAP